MAKVKIQKKDIWIDMTPMSDVMTLLLCFFMLTSTFLNAYVRRDDAASVLLYVDINILDARTHPSHHAELGVRG